MGHDGAMSQFSSQPAQPSAAPPLALPFLMSHFSTDPRPRDFTHPNGIGSIAHVTYPMPERKWNPVLRLSDDDRLELVEPWQAMTVTFDDGSLL